MEKTKKQIDVTLVGGGVMSLTLAVLISEIYPSKKIKIIERLNECGLESSNVLNNAGTGHASYCELNYTPAKDNGEISIQKAIDINEMFENSLEFWAYLSKKYKSFNIKNFLKKTPHISFVWGEKNTKFLKKRYASLKKQPLFKEMHFTTDPMVIQKWAPLLISGRNKKEKIAATKVDHGTDINFSALINELLLLLKKNKNVKIEYNLEVKKINILCDGSQALIIQNKNGKIRHIYSHFIFIGAGGMSINLLQKIGIKEILGYGGFPLSGKWLICKNKELIKKHKAKVYSQAFEGAPPMSIPHLDIRLINGEETLIFGPFAGFTSKFLKNGSYIDFFRSIKFNNIFSLINVSFKSAKLLIYLFKQSLMSHNSKMKQLKCFFPNTQNEDWNSYEAGVRVQIIKKDSNNHVKLEFGTEIIFSNNNSLAGLIGASPGASTACNSMLSVMEKFFPEKNTLKKIEKIIPSYNIKLNKNPDSLQKIRTKTYKSLGLW